VSTSKETYCKAVYPRRGLTSATRYCSHGGVCATELLLTGHCRDCPLVTIEARLNDASAPTVPNAGSVWPTRRCQGESPFGRHGASRFADVLRGVLPHVLAVLPALDQWATAAADLVLMLRDRHDSHSAVLVAPGRASTGVMSMIPCGSVGPRQLSFGAPISR
jgi:hypothetical protein